MIVSFIYTVYNIVNLFMYIYLHRELQQFHLLHVMDPMKMNLSIAQLLLTLYGSVRAADGLHLCEEDSQS